MGGKNRFSKKPNLGPLWCLYDDYDFPFLWTIYNILCVQVAQGYGRGLRDLVNKYNPNTSNDNFPVILGRDGTGRQKDE